MAKFDKEFPVRMTKEDHAEFSDFIKKLNEEMPFSNVSMSSYVLYSIKEQMKRDREKYGIKPPEWK